MEWVILYLVTVFTSAALVIADLATDKNETDRDDLKALMFCALLPPFNVVIGGGAAGLLVLKAIHRVRTAGKGE